MCSLCFPFLIYTVMLDFFFCNDDFFSRTIFFSYFCVSVIILMKSMEIQHQPIVFVRC